MFRNSALLVPFFWMRTHNYSREDKMKPISILVTILLLAGLSVAEDKPARVVRVAGTAEVKVAPDRAIVELGVEKQNPSAVAAKHAADQAARRILASLRNSGIDE